MELLVPLFMWLLSPTPMPAQIAERHYMPDGTLIVRAGETPPMNTVYVRAEDLEHSNIVNESVSVRSTTKRYSSDGTLVVAETDIPPVGTWYIKEHDEVKASHC